MKRERERERERDREGERERGRERERERERERDTFSRGEGREAFSTRESREGIGKNRAEKCSADARSQRRRRRLQQGEQPTRGQQHHWQEPQATPTRRGPGGKGGMFSASATRSLPSLKAPLNSIKEGVSLEDLKCCFALQKPCAKLLDLHE